MRSLKLEGSDMVLGVDWLSLFGPMTFDFVQGSIRFKMGEEAVELCRQFFAIIEESEDNDPPGAIQAVVTGFEDVLRERYKMDQQLKESLTQARSRMKYYADKRRTEREFQEGEWVYLKLHTNQQQSVIRRLNHKISPSYYGPYQIERIVGTVAYKLIFPVGAKIHSTFHVSLLKKKIGDKTLVSEQLPSEVSLDEIKQPEKILQTKIFRKGNSDGTHWLIKWVGQSMEDATWKDSDQILKEFPTFKPWGQCLFTGDGCQNQALPTATVDEGNAELTANLNSEEDDSDDTVWFKLNGVVLLN
ncbi:putative nucleotidyltransferase [Abeliophyllum distichum]|uniref:Nucleotidyltransferase n=1 Tax=Abeliophyllum distichum TaxID=126358 RepID=A0ABD1T1R2_9LAMI